MPLDQAGRVIISPSAPIGLPEFQHLYSTMGATPDEAAANINLRFPTEGKSRLSQAWSQLGINQSPEQYFSPAAVRQRGTEVGAPSTGPAGPDPRTMAQLAPGGINPLATSWPMFQNEAQRNIALNTGAYDPSYASPLKRTEAASFAADRSADYGVGPGSLAMLGQANNRIDPNADDPHLLASQLAGDSTGDSKRVLQSLQHGLAPGQVGPVFGQQEELNMPPGTRPELAAYHPQYGIGGGPSEDSMRSTLDMNLHADPEFQSLMAKDPKRADFVYQQLTGRDHANDLAIHSKIRGKQDQAGINMVLQGIARGDHKDPATGKWMVWEDREAPATGVGGIGEPKPYRQLVPANPEKQRIYDRHYAHATGMSAPATVEATRGQRAGAAMFEKDPEIAAAIQSKQKAWGHALSPQEKLAVAYEIKNPAPTPIGMMGHIGHAAADAGEYVNDAEDAFANYTPVGIAGKWALNKYRDALAEPAGRPALNPAPRPQMQWGGY